MQDVPREHSAVLLTCSKRLSVLNILLCLLLSVLCGLMLRLLFGPSGFNCWISYVPVVSFMYC